MEDEETLQAGTLVSELANAIQHEIHDLFADRVVAASVVVRGVLFAGDQLLRVEELTVGTGTNLICDITNLR